MDIVRAAGVEDFGDTILPPLQTSYIYEESRQSFRYTSAFLIKNATLQERYEAFRTKRRNMGYSEEELEESYGFLLFEDKNKANKLAETGVVTGHCTCSTLGDPSKGVYISKYSDCLDLNRWYQGKSGYIAIMRLTKGRIKTVSENYTQNFTAPSAGYDCHVSDQLSAVSANTSSFMAFERTQYFMYELLEGGQVTAPSPSHVCPFAIVSFSYGDSTKAPSTDPREKSKEEKAVFHYWPWKGQLQISSQVYHVGLKSSTGALIPAKLPAVMKVDRAITMVDLKQLLPKAVFETCFTGEVFLEGVCCSLYELVPSENEDSLSLLTQELREKDLALTVQLNDCGFLILLHSSQFLTYEDAGSNSPEVVQGMFVFPHSRSIQRDTKVSWKKSCFAPDVIQVLPALSYAETELEKCVPDKSGELCGLMEQHIQSYAALIHPGLSVSPSREASIFPDQYDVPDAAKYLYSSRAWTEGAWRSLRSYLDEPIPYHLSVSRATELLVDGREERGDEQEDDVYYCLSSPEGGPATPASWSPEEQTAGEASGHADTSKESNETDTGAKDKGTNVHPMEVPELVPSDLSQHALAEGLQTPATAVCTTEMTEGSTLPTLDDLPMELAALPMELAAEDLEKPAISVCTTADSLTEMTKGSTLPPLDDLPMELAALPMELAAEDLEKPAISVCTTADSLTEMTEGSTLPPLDDLPMELAVEDLEKPAISVCTTADSLTEITEGSTLPPLDDLPMELAAEDLEKPAISVCTTADSLTETTEVSALPTLEDLPTELVVSITSAQTTDVTCGMINAETSTKDSSLQSPSLPQAKMQVEGDNSSNGEFDKANQPSELPKVTPLSKDDWRKRPRRRRRHGKRKVLRSVALQVNDKEAKLAKVNPLTQDDWRRRPRRRHGESKALRGNDKEAKRVLRSSALKDKEPEEEDNVPEPLVHPLKRKTDQWNLKAIFTKCGRIFVPHGSGDKDIQSLEDGKRINHERYDCKMMVEGSLQVPEPMGTEKGPNLAAEMEQKRAFIENLGGQSSSQNSEISEVSSEKNEHNDLLIKRLDTNDNSPDVNVAQVDGMATEPAASLSKDQGTKKRVFVALSLSEFKRVFSKAGKRKLSPPVVEDQSLVKKNKTDTGTDKSECVNVSEADCLETTVCTASKSQPLDPDLARALGLAPKGVRDEEKKCPKNTQLRKDHPGQVDPDTPQATSDKLSQHLTGTLPMGRLRRLQIRGVSAEAIKKKWWLHLHTPALASERQANTKSQQLAHSSDSVRKGHSLQEKESGTDPPTDALTLLADLALSGSNEEVLPEPDPALGPILEEDDCLQSAGSPGTQSAVHHLRGCSTSKSSVPPKSASPKGLEGSQDMVVLISREHCYTLPPSSLPLGLSGALLHVSPLTSSEGLQQHRKNIYGDGTQALRAFLCQEDENREELKKTPECPGKGASRRRKFRCSRSFVEKDGSIQVTRRWKESYDFHLDSKFTNDLKEKAVGRALHGTWDFNIKDTEEQIQLIIHMWIGLFYSRSTARFFPIDPSHASTMSDCEVLDLSKGGQKEAPSLNLGSGVLDLSAKDADVVDLTVERKDSGESPTVSNKDSDVVKNVPSPKDVVSGISGKTDQLDDEERSESSLQKDVSLGDTDLSSLERRDGSDNILCDTAANVCIPQEKAPEAHGTGEDLQGKDPPDPEEGETKCAGLQNVSEVEMVQPAEGGNPPKTKPCTEVEETSDVSHVEQTVAHDQNESRDDDHIEETQKQDHKENNVAEADPPAMDVGIGSTNETMATVNEDVHLSADAQPAVHVGKESIDNADIGDEENMSIDETYQPSQDGNVSKDEVQIEMRHEIEEALPLIGSDPRDKVPPELCEKSTFREENPIAVGSGNVSMAQIPPQEYHDKEHCHEPLLAVQSANDSRDKSLLVHSNNGHASVGEEHSDMQGGNVSINDTPPVEHGEDVCVGETLSEMLDETTCRHEALPENETAPVCDGNSLPVAEANMDSYGDRESKLVQDERKFNTDTVQSQANQPVTQGFQDETSDIVEDQIEKTLLRAGDFTEDNMQNVGVDSNKDTMVSHPEHEKSEAVQDQKEILLTAVDSNMDVTHTQIQVDSITDAPKSELRISNTDASKSDVRLDCSMDITHSDISYPQDDTSDLVKGHIKIPLIEEGNFREDIKGTQISPSYEPDEIVRHRIEIPLTEEGISSVCTPHTDVLHTNSAQKEMREEANSTAADMLKRCYPNQQVNAINSEFDKRCPTPTLDEIPCNYIPCPDSFSVSAAYGSRVREVLDSGKDFVRSPTPTQDELPFDHKPVEDDHPVPTVLLPNSECANNSLTDLILQKEQVHEFDTGKIPIPVEKELHPSRDNHNMPNHVEAIERHPSQTADSSFKSVSTNPSPNLHSISSEKEEFYDHTSLSTQALVRLNDFTLCNKWTSEERLSMPSDHLEQLKTDRKTLTEYQTSSSTRASNSTEVCLKGNSVISTERSCKTAKPMRPVTPPDLVTHTLKEIRLYSQRPVMAVKPSKNEESKGDLSKEGQIKYPLTPDVLKTLQFTIPPRENTTVPVNSTSLVSEVMTRTSESFTGVSEEMNENEENERDQDDVSNQEAEWLKEQLIFRTIHFNKTKDLESFDQYEEEWATQENEFLDSSKPSTSSYSDTLNSIKTGTSVSQTQKDWYNYCHSEVSGRTAKSWIDENEEDFSVSMPSIVTVLDHKGNRVTYEDPTGKPSPNMHTRTIHNSNTTGSNRSLEEFSKKLNQSDLTQSSVDKECLIFSEKMNHMLKAKRRGSSHDKTSSYSRLRHSRSKEETPSDGSPVTVSFSKLKELDGPEEHWEALPSLIGQTIKVAMPKRSAMADKTGRETQPHLQKLSCAKGNEVAHPKVSDMAAECARLYSSMMDDVCGGRKLPSKPEKLKTVCDSSKSRPSINTDFCGQMKREMDDSMHDKLNSIVRQSCKIKFRFFMLVTSADTFFNETKEVLEEQGHCEVGPAQFFLDEDGPSSPLLIILRNEDIAEHICEIPHLLELKKSANVLFAGIDRPDDILNLTHQELFSKGGFVVFEGAALEVLSLCNMKRMSRFLEEMSKKGKWKWMLHYRDSRLLKEQARLSEEAQERKQFLDSCQEAGMVEVLPYHECDVISKERPNYLPCLVRLQVQNISARFPVFITDTTADDAFVKNGIMTMNINSFLLISQSDSCTIS